MLTREVRKSVIIDQVLALGSLSLCVPLDQPCIPLFLALAVVPTDTGSTEHKDDGDAVLVESGSGDGVLELIDDGHGVN